MGLLTSTTRVMYHPYRSRRAVGRATDFARSSTELSSSEKKHATDISERTPKERRTCHNVVALSSLMRRLVSQMGVGKDKAPRRIIARQLFVLSSFPDERARSLGCEFSYKTEERRNCDKRDGRERNCKS